MSGTPSITFAPGERIAERGSEVTRLYRLREGAVLLTLGDDRPVTVVAEAGTLFGEGGADLGRRCTSMIAETAVVAECVTLGEVGMAASVLDMPRLGLDLAESLARRICGIAHGLRFVDDFVLSIQRDIEYQSGAFKAAVDELSRRKGALGALGRKACETTTYRRGRAAEGERDLNRGVTAALGSAKPSSIRQLSAGEWLVREGEPSKEMFVLLSGGLEVTAGGRCVDHVVPSSTVGEIGALLGDEVRQAVGVRAASASRVLRIPYDIFPQLITERPAVLLHVVRALARRLDRSYRLLADLDATLTEVLGELDGPGDSVGADYAWLGHELAEWREDVPELIADLRVRLASMRSNVLDVRKGLGGSRKAIHRGVSFAEVRARHEFARAESSLVRVFSRLRGLSIPEHTSDMAGDVKEAARAVLTYAGLNSAFHHDATRDDGIAPHSVRVAVWSALTARRMGVDAALVDDAVMAALVHDVGMLDAERRRDFRIDRHATEYAAPMLARVRGLSADVYRAVCQHHEFVDGSGYPRRLSGDRMSPAGRILSYSNQLDLLVMKGFSPAEAAVRLRDDASRYDPRVLSAALEILGGCAS